MLKHTEARFLGATERSAPDGRKIYKAIATTSALDRYGEIVLPMGCDDKHFKNNPVLVAIHDSRQVTIGHLHSWEITKDSIVCEFTFTQDDLGQMFERRYVDKDMNAFSIGFRPKSGGVQEIWNPWGGKAPEVKSMEFKLPNGETQTLDFSEMEQIPFAVYTSWDWLELSPVPIPANPEALLLREANGIIARAYEGNTVLRSFVQEKVQRELIPIIKALRAFTDKNEIDFQITEGAVPPHTCDMDDESEWNGAAAKTALAKWASSDGSGEKDTINWAKYSKGFAWFDSSAPDALTSYKLPHHMPDEGEEAGEEEKAADSASGLEVVKRGLTSAMAALLGARGGTDVGEDKAAVYRHLARHYEDAGMECPPMEKEEGYSPEEIKSIEEGNWSKARAEQALQADPPVEKISETGKEGVEPPVAQAQPELELLQKIHKQIRDLAESVDEHFIDLSIRMTRVEEKAGVAPVRKAEPKTVQEPPVTGQEAQPVTVSASLIEKLSSFTM